MMSETVVHTGCVMITRQNKKLQKINQTHLCVLFQQHLVQDGDQPVLKLTVVVIGDQQVPNPELDKKKLNSI